MATIVKTKDELKKAVQNKEKEIIIHNGQLAKDIVKFKEIKKLSKWTLNLLLAATGVGAIGIAMAPFTFGPSAFAGLLSSGALFSISTASGTAISVEAIIAIGFLAILGSAVLFAIWRDYQAISDPPKIILKKDRV